jgi:aryl-alcohol dehydrogenase-like predicted oxidoreductase
VIDLSKIVVGTWPLSGDYGYMEPKASRDILNYCYETGFRAFDTAPSYGNGFIELRLGEVFAKKKGIIINTKVGNIPHKGKSFNVKDLRISLNESLKRLNREKINILFLHNPRDEVRNYSEMLELMGKLKAEGKIKYSGISLAKMYKYKSKILNMFDYVQDDFNLLSMNFLKYNLDNKTKFMARSPLASGLLSGKATKNLLFPSDDHRSEWLKGERLVSILKRIDNIKRISNIELPSLAKRFVLSMDEINDVIFGVRHQSHVDSIIDDLKSPPLEYKVIKKLISLYENDFGLISEKHLTY